jgi:hypothetical protein
LTKFESFHESTRADALFEVADPFRLVIRGYALVDERLHEVVDAAFPGGTPAELKRLRLESRLALAQALGFLLPDVARATGVLAGIRHRLAHGTDGEVTKADFHALQAVFDDLFEADMNDMSKADKLRLMVLGIWQAMGNYANLALSERAERDTALAEKRKLSPEFIRELMEHEDVPIDEEAEARAPDSA